MHSAGNVNESEMEGKNGEDPSVNAGTGVEIWISEHAFDIMRINFDNQIPNTYQVKFL